jgi:lysophospholipase L1-like esterase
VLHLGTNDIGQNHTLPEMINDMATLLHNISVVLPRARVFLCTILYMVNSANPQWVPQVASYNRALIENFGALKNVDIIDLATASGLCNANDSPLRRMCAQCNPSSCTDPSFYDRVHPTAAGYSVMGGVIAAGLMAAL